MKRRYFFVLVVLFSLCFSSEAFCKKKPESIVYDYEVQCFGVGVEGTYSLKVWSYSKKPALAKGLCKRNAIHGVIFKGVAAGNNCSSQPPLAGSNKNLYEEHKAFFDKFFSENGKYLQFINLSNNGVPLPGDMQKVAKHKYKVGIVVSVQKDALRKYLEDEKVLKGLSDGF